MTSKQKAGELIYKYLNAEYAFLYEVAVNPQAVAKTYALICCNEILATNIDQSKYGKVFTDYWNEVKNEIEKL